MIHPRYATGCRGFDHHTDILSADAFIRSKTQFSIRIPTTTEGYDAAGRRLPSYVFIKAKETAPGGILYEFGNPATNRQGWRTHGWIAIDRHGTPLWVLSCPQAVCVKVMSALRTKLFSIIPMHVGTVRFPSAFNGDRANLARQDRLATTRARSVARIAMETQKASKQFHSETKRRAKLDLLNPPDLDDQLDAILADA